MNICACINNRQETGLTCRGSCQTRTSLALISWMATKIMISILLHLLHLLSVLHLADGAVADQEGDRWFLGLTDLCCRSVQSQCVAQCNGKDWIFFHESVKLDNESMEFDHVC